MAKKGRSASKPANKTRKEKKVTSHKNPDGIGAEKEFRRHGQERKVRREELTNPKRKSELDVINVRVSLAKESRRGGARVSEEAREKTAERAEKRRGSRGYCKRRKCSP